jgi:hypothetical protein
MASEISAFSAIRHLADYQSGNLCESETEDLFQRLINSRLDLSFGDSIAQTAGAMVAAGVCIRPPVI